MDQLVFGHGQRLVVLAPGEKVPWRAHSPDKIKETGLSLSKEYDKAVYWLEQVSMVNLKLLQQVQPKKNKQCVVQEAIWTPLSSTLGVDEMLGLLDNTLLL
jgi:hypothetical protein